MEYNIKDHVLIKSERSHFGYSIVSKERQFEIIEDNELAKQTIELLLKKGVKVYDSWDEYNKDFPERTYLEKMESGMDFWINHIPEKDWPQKVKEYYERKNL